MADQKQRRGSKLDIKLSEELRVTAPRRNSCISPGSNSSGAPRDLQTNIKVAVRVRPKTTLEEVKTTQELDKGKQNSIEFLGTETLVVGPQKEMASFDFVFPPRATQKEIFDQVGLPMIDDVLLGYNGTLFCYGQTGSGKTHSMMGSDFYDEHRGIIPRAAEELFRRVENTEVVSQWTFKCSMVEIYKEKLNDLLCPQGQKLKIKEDSRKGIYVEGLKVVCVESQDELFEVISLGEQMRTVAATHWNPVSSRSHQIFMLEVEQLLENDLEKRGVLNLVDLAGSEKMTFRGMSGNVLEEAKKINLSLSALGNVIYALTQGYEHIPYRNSKLTRLLQESLGGNYKTTVLITLSPCCKAVDETINTLKFAQRVKRIKNCAKVNVKRPVEEYITMITQLREELGKVYRETAHLKSQLALSSSPSSTQLTPCHSVGYFDSPPPPPHCKSLSICNNTWDVSLGKSRYIKPKSALFPRETPQSTETPSELDSSALKFLQEQLLKAQIRLLKSETECHQLTEDNERLKLQQFTQNQETEYLRQKILGKERIEKELQRKLRELEGKCREMARLSEGNSTVYEFEGVGEAEEGSSAIAEAMVADSFYSSLCKVNCKQSSPYLNTLQRALEDNTELTCELNLFRMQCELLTAAQVNCKLGVAVHTFSWKNTLLRHKYEYAKQRCEYQQNTIAAMESVIDTLHQSYLHIAKKVEGLDYTSVPAPAALPKKEVKAFVRRCVRIPVSIENRPLSRITSLLSNFTSEESLHQHPTDPPFSLHSSSLQYLHHALDQAQLEAQQSCRLIEVLEASTMERVRKEEAGWTRCIARTREVYERELLRKQREVERLCKVLGVWASQCGEVGMDVTVVEEKSRGRVGNIEKCAGDDGLVDTEGIK